MPKLTRRIKNNKKNRSIKQYGGYEFQKLPETQLNDKAPLNSEREGVIDIIKDNISNVANSAAKIITDAGLKIVGLQRINKTPENDANDKDIDTKSGIVSNVENVADKTGAALIENVNEVLGSNAAKETTIQAANKTANIIKENARIFNDALNNPEVKVELEKAIQNASEVGNIIVDAAKEPFDRAVDNTAESLQKAMPKFSSALSKSLWDAAGAIPLLNIPIETLNVVNDITKAASATTQAGSEAVQAGSEFFISAKENIDQGLRDLENKKKIGGQISNRITKSIKQFENPTIIQSQTGGKKTRRFLKYRAKTKRVRFAV